MTSILGIGECMVELSSAGEGLWRQGFSGDVFNTLWYARALAPSDVTVSFHTAVGADPLSDQMLDFAEHAGINCDNTPRIADRRPGLYSIHLNGAERSFNYWRDTSAARLMMMHPDALWSKVANADVVYFSGITLAILPDKGREILLSNILSHMKKDAVLAFDPNIRPHLWPNRDCMRDVISKAASLCDIVLPSFDDEVAAFGDRSPEETANRYRALGADHIVVKNGTADTVHLQEGVMTSFPVAPIDGVIDTTAAGDSFNGAYIAALVGDLATADAIGVAQRCAGQVVTRKGALVPHSDLKSSFSQ